MMQEEGIPGALSAEDCQRDVGEIRQTLISSYTSRTRQELVFPWSTDRSSADLYIPQRLSTVNEKVIEGRSTTVKKNLTNLHDFFYSDGIMCQNIFLTGAPGIGKSIFCMHLVDEWCQAQTAADEEGLGGDAKTLKHFSLLFYLRLRGVSLDSQKSDVEQLTELIQDQIDPLFDNGDLLNIDSTLVVLDGLDEMGGTDILQRGSNNESTIIITGRPWILNTVKSNPVFKVDQHVVLEGVKEAQAKQLVSQLLLFSLPIILKEPVEDLHNFIKDVKSKGFSRFLSIWNNWHLLQAFILWSKNKTLGQTLWEFFSHTIHISILQSAKLLDQSSTVEPEFPFPCQEQNCVCKQQHGLLWRLARFAFHTLLSENIPSLVFKPNDLEDAGLTQQDVKACHQMEILVSLNHFTEVMDGKSFTFKHRIIQEYFAAMHLSNKLQNSDGLDFLDTHIPNLNKILEMEIVLVVLVGYQPSLARSITDFIMRKSIDDNRIGAYRMARKEWVAELDLVKSVQKLILSVTNECRQQENISLHLKDIYLDNDNVMDMTNMLVNLDISDAQTFLMQGRLAIEEFNAGLEKLNRLQKLYIDYCMVPMDLLGKLISRSLTTLEMWDVKLTRDALQMLMNELSQTNELREVILCHLSLGTTMEEFERCDYKLDLSQLLKLERVVIKGSCVISQLYFSKTMGNLAEVRLTDGVKMTAYCIEDMFPTLPEHPLKLILKIAVADRD